MPMETRSSICFSNTLLKKNSRKFSRTAAVSGEKSEKYLIFDFPPPHGCRRRNFVFLVANCQHGDRNQLVPRSELDLDIDSAQGQPARYLARPTNIDDGLEGIRWSHGLGGESLRAASHGILTNQKKSLFFAIRDGCRIVFFCFVQTSGEMFFNLTPGELPPHGTGHRVKTVTLGSEPLTSALRSESMTQSLVMLIDVCEDSKKLAALNQRSA